MRNSIALQAIFLFLFSYLANSATSVETATLSSSSTPLNGGCITSGNQTVFYEDLPNDIYADGPYGGGCEWYNYHYQWQWSTDNIFFKDINGATNSSLSITNDQELREGATLPYTIYIQRKTTCGLQVAYTNSISITYTMVTSAIFARLEETLLEPMGSPEGDEIYYSQAVRLIIHFYSDAACTNPVNLPFNVNYAISFTGYYTTESGTEYFNDTYGTGTGYAGNNTAFFDEPTWENMLASGGIIYEKTRQDYELASISGGVVIKPTLYAAHTEGF